VAVCLWVPRLPIWPLRDLHCRPILQCRPIHSEQLSSLKPRIEALEGVPPSLIARLDGLGLDASKSSRPGPYGTKIPCLANSMLSLVVTWPSSPPSKT
jgi:hypothetical protein